MWDFTFFRRRHYVSRLGDKVIITREDEGKTGKNNFAFSDISPMWSQSPGFFTARAYLHLWILSAGHRLKSLATHRGSLMTSDCLNCQSLFIATGTKQNKNEEGGPPPRRAEKRQGREGGGRGLRSEGAPHRQRSRPFQGQSAAQPSGELQNHPRRLQNVRARTAHRPESGRGRRDGPPRRAHTRGRGGKGPLSLTARD